MRVAHVPSVLSVGSALDMERSVYAVKAKTGRVTGANRADVVGDAMYAVDAGCVRFVNTYIAVRTVFLVMILYLCRLAVI